MFFYRIKLYAIRQNNDFLSMKITGAYVESIGWANWDYRKINPRMPTAHTYQAKCWNLPFCTKFMSHLRAMMPKMKATTMPTRSSGVKLPASAHLAAFSGFSRAIWATFSTFWHLNHLSTSSNAAPPTAGMLMRKLNSPAYLRFTPMNIMALMVEPLRLMPGMQAMPCT